MTNILLGKPIKNVWYESPKHALINLCDYQHYKVYENKCYFDEHLYDLVDIKMYKLLEKVSMNFDENEAELDYDSKYLAWLFDSVYNCFKKEYEVETNKNLPGMFRDNTIVDMYIKELNMVIINPFLICDDILNLLSMKGINIYIYKVDYAGRYDLFDVCLYAISLKKGATSSFTKEIKDRQHLITECKTKIQSTAPRYSLDTYFTLNDRERAKRVYNSLTDEDKRMLQEFLVDARGDYVISMVAGHKECLDVFANHFLALDLLMQSYNNIEEYNENKAEKLEADKKKNYKKFMRTYSYANNFADYKLLIKDFNERYKFFRKWIKEWHDIVKEDAEVVTYTPNKEGIHYKVAEELATRLSKLWFISEVILFGSVAKGKEQEGSDIDIVYKVGIDCTNLTLARRETMYNLVKHEVAIIEEKYPELVEKQLRKAYGENYRFKIYPRTKLFDVLAIQFQKKKMIKFYNETGFLDNSIVLHKKDSFTISCGEYIKNLKFSDVEYAIFPTDNSYSFLVNKVSESETHMCLEYVKFDYQMSDYISDKPSEYQVEYVAQQMVNKEKGINSYHIKIEPIEPSCLPIEEKMNLRYNEEGVIGREIGNGGMRNCNPKSDCLDGIRIV